jgi:dipeptidyl aminopeptidase/acylaminoacyl peptidase
MFRVVMSLVAAALLIVPGAAAAGDLQEPTGWQTPPEAVMKVLHAPQLPWVWTAPSGTHLMLADPVTYPPLAELASPMHVLAGMRVDPAVGNIHGRHGATTPRLVAVGSGAEVPLPLPAGIEVHGVSWTADGRRFAMITRHADHMGLWVGSVEGELKKIENLAVNQLLGSGASWLPDQQRLLVRRYPDRGAAPEPPAIPAGPEILEGSGATARSTYEARNLLETAHDDALFDYWATSELVVVDPAKGTLEVLGEPAVFATADFSPDGRFLLVERLVGPWSHEVPWWRFASELEIRDADGKKVATVASLPVADQVPIHGVPLGPRDASWRATAPHELYWVEALDGGNPVAEAEHRDRLMRLRAPFTGAPEDVFRAEHRIVDWQDGWGAEGGTLMLTERERIRRWLYTWLLDVDAGSSRPWFDLNEDDRYSSPGSPVRRPLPNGEWVLRQKGDAVYFSGSGATDEGDRPFLDLRHMETGAVERLFRSDPERYEVFVAFAGGDDRFVMRSESAVEVPNYYLATLGEDDRGARRRGHPRPHPRAHHPLRGPDARAAADREAPRALRARGRRAAQLRAQPAARVRRGHPPADRALRLPPGVLRPLHRRPGARLEPALQPLLRRLPPLLPAPGLRGARQHDHAHDRRPRDNLRHLRAAAGGRRRGRGGQGGGDRRRRPRAHRHHRPQPRRTHGGQPAGPHRPLPRRHRPLGLHNKTMQPFGFQSERRSLFEARDAYIELSPTFFADKVDEPVLVIHGKADSNPGTLTIQSEVFFEAVRGSGGTARLVLLPFEDHGYRAEESVEHVLWEQIRWFDQYVKNADANQ